MRSKPREVDLAIKRIRFMQVRSPLSWTAPHVPASVDKDGGITPSRTANDRRDVAAEAAETFDEADLDPGASGSQSRREPGRT